jgi:DNA-binding NarL/FixJ family response regulator
MDSYRSSRKAEIDALIAAALEASVIVEVETELTGREVETELTGRELAVLAAVARGASNKVVASQLSISVETVRSRLKRIYRKLGVHNRSQAMLPAYRLGIADVEAAS